MIHVVPLTPLFLVSAAVADSPSCSPAACCCRPHTQGWPPNCHAPGSIQLRFRHPLWLCHRSRTRCWRRRCGAGRRRRRRRSRSWARWCPTAAATTRCSRRRSERRRGVRLALSAVGASHRLMTAVWDRACVVVCCWCHEHGGRRPADPTLNPKPQPPVHVRCPAAPAESAE